MGILNSTKNAIKATGKWLRGEIPQADAPAEYTASDALAFGYPNTTAGRRAKRVAEAKYLHISVPMKENPVYRVIVDSFGVAGARRAGIEPFTADIAHMPGGRGITRNVRRNAVKRYCDNMGANRNERNAIRRAVLADLAEAA